MFDNNLRNLIEEMVSFLRGQNSPEDFIEFNVDMKKRFIKDRLRHFAKSEVD